MVNFLIFPLSFQGKFDGVPTEDELRVMTCPNTGVTELELLNQLGKADQDQFRISGNVPRYTGLTTSARGQET